MAIENVQQLLTEQMGKNRCDIISTTNMTSKEDLMQQYRQMIEALQTENKNLKQRLEWYDNFVDYVMQYDNNVYNSACEYADELEKDDENEKAD